MKTYSSLAVLAALGTLCVLAGDPAAAAPAVDTSAWTCSSCPFDKDGTEAELTAGAGVVDGRSARSVEFTGVDRRGGFAVLGGGLRWRDAAGGLRVDAEAEDLGLETRALRVDAAREGLLRLRAGYAEIPKTLVVSGLTPLAAGGATIVPPAAGAALQPLDVGWKRKAADAVLSGPVLDGWDWRVSLRRDERDGTQRVAGSFAGLAARLPAPLDERTESVDASVGFALGAVQASAGWRWSRFSNRLASVKWAGTPAGELALAPGNELQEFYASAGWNAGPGLRISADVSAGRLLQDEAFLAPTLNAALAAGLPATPVSLRQKVETFDATVRATANPLDHVRVHASLSRSVRDNRTPSTSWPGVVADLFVDPASRTTQPYDFNRDLLKFGVDWRGAARLAVSLGADVDVRGWSRQEVSRTQENTVWARVSAPLGDAVSVAAKASHAARRHEGYGVATWIAAPQNPLLRKFNFADRLRDALHLRADVRPGDAVAVGLTADFAYDDYDHTALGLEDGRSVALGADVSAAIGDNLTLRAFGQIERLRARQSGSTAFAAADWRGTTADASNVLGLGLRHSLLDGKLVVDADLSVARSRSDVSVATGSALPPFPTQKTRQDSLSVQAAYQVDARLAVIGRLAHERLDGADWRWDEVGATSVPGLLTLGETTPRHRVGLASVALRWRF